MVVSATAATLDGCVIQLAEPTPTSEDAKRVSRTEIYFDGHYLILKDDIPPVDVTGFRFVRPPAKGDQAGRIATLAYLLDPIVRGCAAS